MAVVLSAFNEFGIAFVLFFGSLIGIPVIAYVAVAELLASIALSSVRRWLAFAGLIIFGFVAFCIYLMTRPNWRWPETTAEWRLVAALMLPIAAVVGLYAAKMATDAKRA